MLWIARQRISEIIRAVLTPRLAYAAGPTAWTPTNTTRTKFLNGQFDWDTDTLKIALFASTSNLAAASTTFAGVTNELATSGGYTAGGITVSAGTLAGTTTVTADITTDPVWTASGGGFAARFAALYESGGDVIFFCTLDSAPADVTVAAPNTLTISTPSGVFTLA